MSHKAYLLVWINIRKFPPIVERLSIHSEDADSITRMSSSLVFTLHMANGSSYQEAHDKIINDINTSLLYEELRPYFHIGTQELLHREMAEYVESLPSLAAKILGSK